jgi:hypothetical protein
MPNKSSKFAVEGTAAHQLAEDCLLDGTDAMDHIDGAVTLEDDAGNQTEHLITENMAEAVQVYLNDVRVIASGLGVVPRTERRLHLEWIDVRLFGTNDVSIELPFGTLYMRDYKHGQGIAVDVAYPEPKVYFAGGSSDKNPQLMYYALGAVEEGNPKCFADVDIGITQPRAPHPDGSVRSVNVTIEELFKWRDEVLIPGVKATDDPNAPLCAGTHCKFCRAIPVCPEVGKVVTHTAKLTAKQVFGNEPMVFPNPADMTTEDRVKIYALMELFGSWMKAVQSDTHDKLKAGHNIPGLKLVQGRASRKWNDASAVDIESELESQLGAEAFNKKMKTPAQIEKALKSIGSDAKMFEQYVTTSHGTSVALESDRRQPLQIQDAAQAFGK